MARMGWQNGVVLLAVALFLVAPTGFGQTASGKKVVIAKVDVKSIKSPTYGGAISDTRARSPEDWWQLMLEYTTASGDGKPGWQDDLSVEWDVLIRRKNLKPILLRRTVAFVDVDDRKIPHYAAMYLRPGFIKRYCKGVARRDIQIYVQVKVNGKTEDRKNLSENDMSDVRWWEWETPKVDLRDAELLPPDETPFAPLDYDHYEHAQKQATQRAP